MLNSLAKKGWHDGKSFGLTEKLCQGKRRGQLFVRRRKPADQPVIGLETFCRA